VKREGRWREEEEEGSEATCCLSVEVADGTVQSLLGIEEEREEEEKEEGGVLAKRVHGGGDGRDLSSTQWLHEEKLLLVADPDGHHMCFAESTVMSRPSLSSPSFIPSSFLPHSFSRIQL
jgi:hypothetical protein